jgi:GTP-binding protein LepA
MGVGDQIKLMNTGATFTVEEVGIMRPQKVPVERLSAGEVGYVVANIKSVADARVGDTITSVGLTCTAVESSWPIALERTW